MRRLRVPKPSRTGVAASMLVLILLGGGWFWVRDSSLVRVSQVDVKGLHSAQARVVESALRSEATEMTTLHIRKRALERAVARFSSVAKISVQRHFPHKLTITVTEHRPVAVLLTQQGRILVTGSGHLLRDLPGKHHLPEVRPKKMVSGNQLTDSHDSAIVTMLAGSPPELRSRILKAGFDDKGLRVELRNGPHILFGTPIRIDKKWQAATRVLAEPSAAGATYIDVRLPERVAVGGLKTAAQAKAEQEEERATNGNLQP